MHITRQVPDSHEIMLIKVFIIWAKSSLFFVNSHPFLIPISISTIQIEKSVDGMLGIRTQGYRMVGADETTELWQPPMLIELVLVCS